LVVLSGGCFQNQLFRQLVEEALIVNGFGVKTASLAPSNDGGLALGLAAVAAERSSSG
jgi:hydrogenase maturation protein HypF